MTRDAMIAKLEGSRVVSPPNTGIYLVDEETIDAVIAALRAAPPADIALREAASAVYEAYGPAEDYTHESRRLWERLRDALAAPHADAGADALHRGTCGTCKWLRHVGAREDDTEPACGHESEAHPLHWCRPVGDPETFGCTYHEAKEVSRG